MTDDKTDDKDPFFITDGDYHRLLVRAGGPEKVEALAVAIFRQELARRDAQRVRECVEVARATAERLGRDPRSERRWRNRDWKRVVEALDRVQAAIKKAAPAEPSA